MTLKQLKEKIVQYGFLFVYAKFHGNFFIKTIFFFLSLISNICYKILQARKKLQSTIELFECASISQRNESMRCYSPLITHFNHKIFSKYLGPPHIKCDVMKIA